MNQRSTKVTVIETYEIFSRMHQMNRFGSDVVFGSDAAVLKSPTATYLTLKSRSTAKQVHCP